MGIILGTFSPFAPLCPDIILTLISNCVVRINANTFACITVAFFILSAAIRSAIFDNNFAIDNSFNQTSTVSAQLLRLPNQFETVHLTTFIGLNGYSEWTSFNSLPVVISERHWVVVVVIFEIVEIISWREIFWIFFKRYLIDDNTLH